MQKFQEREGTPVWSSPGVLQMSGSPAPAPDRAEEEIAIPEKSGDAVFQTVADHVSGIERRVSLAVVEDEGPGDDAADAVAPVKRTRDIRVSIVESAASAGGGAAKQFEVETPAAKARAPPVEARAPMPPPRSYALSYFFLLIAVACLYFDRVRAPEPHVRLRARAWAPKVVTKLEIVSGWPTRVAWKRDLGFVVEADVTLRIFNPAPLPLRVRTLNVTALLRSVGSDALAAAGYKVAKDFRVPGRSSADVPSKLVLHDLRPAQVAAVVVDAATEVACASIAPALCGRDGFSRPALESHLEGTLALWPAGRIDVACVMTAPLDVAGMPLPVENACRAKLL